MDVSRTTGVRKRKRQTVIRKVEVAKRKKKKDYRETETSTGRESFAENDDWFAIRMDVVN